MLIYGDSFDAVARQSLKQEPMWKRISISDDKRYVLNLCQNGKGHRYCVVTEVGVSAPDVIRQTVEIHPELVRKVALEEVTKVPLTDGTHFVFGPHGEWFTTAEAEALADDHPVVPWITAKPPLLAAK